ncbi:hypothetical protein PA598K_05699 [Paenibacillus sp. 598K]|nr:hypothetical protein PA598K_05699 [Paenibacillus sp. 598K]
MLLIELMDSLLDTLDRDPDFRSFHLDGQTIIIDDYLQVRPQARERLERHIRNGRIVIGPWYILQDEFLTSSEANVRNLLIGHQDAAPHGVISKLGYFPDSFGNMGQAPQLLKQADIETAVFGRGVKPTGFNNMVSDVESYESPYSEMFWESPDGSRVLGILFANWYSNGNEVPALPEAAKPYWDKKLADAAKYASTPELLFMNGCDHQPVQTDLTAALATARQLFPDVEFVHSTFDEYIAAVREKLQPEKLVTVEGELRSQRTDGWGTLVNTASARVYLKQLNAAGQTLLEKGAEPLAALARLAVGKPYPHDQLTYAWKTLMQNHPHDSICGCSVDEVHREMVSRFDKSRHTAEYIIDESLDALASAIDTTGFAAYGEQAYPFAVFNTTGWTRSLTVTIELETDKLYFRERPSIAAATAELEAMPLERERYALIDAAGREVYAAAEDLGVHFGYDLPKDQFRQPYMARRIRLSFEAAALPALGYRAYAWVKRAAGVAATEASAVAGAGTAGAAAIAAAGASIVGALASQANNQAHSLSGDQTAERSMLRTHARGMKNRHVAVEIAGNGSLTLTDQRTGRVYTDLLVYEDCGDLGNEYVFKQPNGEQPLTTREVEAQVRLIEDEPYRAVFEIVHEWQVPASADASFEEEKRRIVPFTKRQAQRTSEMVPLRIVTTVALDRDGAGLQVRSSFDNQARDHRLRVLFPSGIKAAQHAADSIFEVARRDTVPAPEWINPSNAQHQQCFVSVSDEQHGLTIAGKGLHEYEVLQDEQGTIAVTLLRAVSELGDWGVFPTPEAQCLGEQYAEFAIYPHAGDVVSSEAYAQAYQFQTPTFAVQTGVHAGSLQPEHRFLDWSGPSLALSAVKLSRTHEDLILRWFNLDRAASELSFAPGFAAGEVYRSDILERRREPIAGWAAAGATDASAAGGVSVEASNADAATAETANADGASAAAAHTEVRPSISQPVSRAEIVTYALTLDGIR